MRFYQAIVQTGLAGVVGDFERIVPTRVGRKVFHAVDDFFHVGRLFPGAFGHIVIRLSISDGRRQGAQPCLLCLFIQIVFGDDIGKGPVHGEQFRDVLEFGEAAFELVVHPCGVEFPAACDLAEGGGPGVKMVYALGLQFLILHVALERVHFGNGVRYGGAGQKVHAPAFVFPLQVAAFDEEIERFGRTCDIAQTGDVHGGLIGKVLELVAFVHKERIHAQVGEINGGILFPRAREQKFIAGFHVFPLLFKLLDRGPASFRLLHGLNGFQHRINLLLQNLPLNVVRHVDFTEGAVRDDNGIPVSGRNTGKKPFPVLFGEVGLVRHQNMGIGIELVELIPPLVEKVVGDDHHRFGNKAHALGFHDGRYAGHGLSRADDVIEQGRAFLNGPPDGILLVRPKFYF